MPANDTAFDHDQDKIFVEIPHDNSLSITGDLTIEFWLLLKDWPADWTDIISKIENDKNNEFCFRLRDDEVGQWYYGDGNNANALKWVPSEDISLNEWTHVALVRKAGEYGRIYINGVLQRECSWHRKPAAVNTKSPVIISGIVRDVRIWSRARDQDGIKEYMSKNFIGEHEGLVGCWELNRYKNENVFLDLAGKNHGSIAIMNQGVDFSLYDFIDFGCKKGGSIKAAQKMFDGGRGIGLDINVRNVMETKKEGYEAAWFDVTRLAEHEKQVRFVMMSHFLEHLSGYNDAYSCIKSACLIAKDFIFIRQPYFDADPFLFSLGLNVYWSGWSGHQNRMTSLEFYLILRELLGEGLIHCFKIYNYGEIENISYECISRIDPGIELCPGENKSSIAGEVKVFKNQVFRETRVLIGLNREVKMEELEKAFLFDNLVYSSC